MKNNSNEIWKDILELSHTVRHQFKLYFEDIAANHNLTMQQMLILIGIENRQLCSIRDIADNFHLYHANASTLCKQLEKLKLIHRVRSPDDIRVVQLSLSDYGESIAQDLRNAISLRTQALHNNQIDTEKIKQGLLELQKMSQLLKGE